MICFSSYSSPCVTNKKDEKRRIFNSLLDSDNIVVVIQEIESWYYAGLESEKCSELNVSVLSSTDSMKKEDFNRLIPQEHTHLTFMLEILDIYSLDIAAQKNNSVNYFLNKHVYQHNGSSS